MNPRISNTRLGFFQPKRANDPWGMVDFLQKYLSSTLLNGQPEMFQLIDQILDHPKSDFSCKGIAYSIRGELKRGTEHFAEARKDYRAAISAVSKLRPAVRHRNAFVRHWTPRANIGLFTVERRILHPNPNELMNRLINFSQNTQDYDNGDLKAQIQVAEAELLRQMGSLERAYQLLSKAIQQVTSIRVPYYSFWLPDHFRAHRLQIALLSPGLQHLAEFEAKELESKPNTDTWSLAMAKLALLHLRLDAFSRGELTFAHQATGEIHSLLSEAVHFGKLSNDPSLESDANMLGAVWGAACNHKGLCEDHLGMVSLISQRNHSGYHLKLLRGIETAAMLKTWPIYQAEPLVVQSIIGNAKTAFTQLKTRLLKYNCDQTSLDEIGHWLFQPFYKNDLKEKTPWISPLLAALRCRLWP